MQPLSRGGGRTCGDGLVGFVWYLSLTTFVFRRGAAIERFWKCLRRRLLVIRAPRTRRRTGWGALSTAVRSGRRGGRCR